MTEDERIRAAYARSPERERAEQEALRMWPKNLHLGRWDGIMVSPEQSLAGQRQAFQMGVEFCMRRRAEAALGDARVQVDREALTKLAAEWQQSADEDERYLNRAHASEIHDVEASIRIGREHATAVLALLSPDSGLS